jgi:hypothetical protein
MTKDRQIIAMAVLEGKLPPETLTWKEIKQLDQLIFETVSNKYKTVMYVSETVH